MSEPVLFEQSEGIALITLNRPETRNPISDPDMIEAILAVLARIEADLTVRVAILTGAGSAFSSGGNLKKMGEQGGVNDPLPAQTRRNYKHGIQRLPLAFAALDVPVIAAVNGPAIGAGCDLACMCDLRIAGQSARFAESFVKLGIVPGDGGAWLLPRVVGFAKASEMALTGDAIDAAEALACGLVSKIVPDAELLDHARVLAQRIACNPPHAVRMTKRLLQKARDSNLETVLDLSATMQALAHATADHKEAIAAMLGKRAPTFVGQ
ncbi:MULTISPECIES: crotonase/enoyl-CoA hydratase family protein [Nitrospirillum]|uniref:Enoyl-CoA hydratase/carnithine racemase n=1 Tax=Nitrospirillum amazonense TaxID=28077 RepID=A0A560F9W9_9PROT|nr:crotonase/enoyl-CoA hydratase family protein [Nitrospirillum amazonense]TWB18417.1 enoyl-CoA hydratase/carnithine racemase [Nitrospirillum amazonense]TWB25654.1 enoyl-CoA hydratase/carnithine racemase [Nitrospirillum amazonense]TWB66062.1 enoyl-CoA hydratase/carnithine racemase [Nitrospirillum amazonense]